MLRVQDDLKILEIKAMRENFSQCNEFVRIGNTIKLVWAALKNQTSKLLSAAKIDYCSVENKDNLIKSKHVMFADKLGLELEMIHTKNANPIVNKNESGLSEIKTNDELLIQIEKTILPKFAIFPKTSYRRLVKNGICLNSFEIYNQTSIRGIILTLQNYSMTAFKESNELRKNNAKQIFAKNNQASHINIDSEINSLNLNVDLVYVIWSIDEWKSWKYQAAIQKNSKANPKKGVIKTHEFFIQNLENVLQITQRLKLIVCHQIGLIVFKDTNNEKGYQFDCAIKI